MLAPTSCHPWQRHWAIPSLPRLIPETDTGTQSDVDLLLSLLRMLAPTSCHSWQRHWAIGLFPVSSLRQILGQKGMRITAPFAFAFLPLPLAIPGKGTGLFRLFQLLGGWVPQRYFQARLLTRHKFSGQFPVPKIAPVRLVAPAPPRPYLRQQMRHG